MRRRHWLKEGRVPIAPRFVRWLGFLPPVRRYWFRELREIALSRSTSSFASALHDKRVWIEHARQMNDDMSYPGDPEYWDEENCPV